MSEPTTLQDLYMSHQGFVSDKWSFYIPIYSELFEKIRNSPISLLEIGVQNGGSLDIWSRYFSKATHIVGCDINPSCAQLEYSSKNVSIIIGDINKPETLIAIHATTCEFDIIIDDGSHLSSDIIKSFSNLFSLLQYDGLYIAEDLHCGYWAEYEGGLDNPTSCISFFKALSDIVNYEHWGLPVSRLERLSVFCITPGLTEELLSEVHSVEFVNSMCIIRRRKSFENHLGARIVKGNRDFVVPVHHLNGSLSQTPTQSFHTSSADPKNNLHTNNENSVAAESKHDKKDESFREKTASIAVLEAEKIRLRKQLQMIETQLVLIKETQQKDGMV
ncbi:class I SAM-dependent methyltransferase [Pseudomonas syringae]|uniref:class I SAM-dependent methyltransferase n=1 Tax=Pseudomonas syringae TaxID=317 RepID=UPI00215A933E|nr:class I SAM-dependent methyltransferase [Pseudomonas syringae]MCR8720536.1 class I SAM-dependent methyltransferase [Pseudomonas syringae]